MPGTSRSQMFIGSYEFSPVPLFAWNTETIRDGRGEELVIRHILDFAGTVLAPASESGVLDVTLSSRESLQQALASGGEFRLLYDGVHQISGIYPRATAVQFSEDTWVDRLDYTFQFVYEEDAYAEGIQQFSENWSFEESEDRRSVTARHDLLAQGFDTNPSGVNNALANARTYVLSKTGYSNVVAGHPAFVQVSGVSYNAYEELRSENADVAAGSFSVSETFILSSGNYTHTSTAQLGIDADGVSTVSMDGVVQGLGRGDTAYPRAVSAWNTIKSRLPADASGIYSELGGDATLYTNNYENFSVTRDRFNSTINYSVSYTDDPTENLPSGILEFSLDVSDTAPVRLYASFAIPERTLGNVIQDIATPTEGSYTISGNATGKQDYAFTDLLDYVEGKINEKRPLSANYVTLRLDSHSVTKDEDSNTVQFNLTWRYTKSLSQAKVDGPVTLD